MQTHIYLLKGEINMAIYADSLPYLQAQVKRVALPRIDSITNKIGFNNISKIIFLS